MIRVNLSNEENIRVQPIDNIIVVDLSKGETVPSGYVPLNLPITSRRTSWFSFNAEKCHHVCIAYRRRKEEKSFDDFIPISHLMISFKNAKGKWKPNPPGIYIYIYIYMYIICIDV